MHDLFLTSSGWSVILVSPVSRTGAITLSFWSVPLETVSRVHIHYRTTSKRINLLSYSTVHENMDLVHVGNV